MRYILVLKFCPHFSTLCHHFLCANYSNFFLLFFHTFPYFFVCKYSTFLHTPGAHLFSFPCLLFPILCGFRETGRVQKGMQKGCTQKGCKKGALWVHTKRVQKGCIMGAPSFTIFRPLFRLICFSAFPCIHLLQTRWYLPSCVSLPDSARM